MAPSLRLLDAVSLLALLVINIKKLNFIHNVNGNRTTTATAKIILKGDINRHHIA